MLTLNVVRGKTPVEETWKSLDSLGFPKYSISSHGKVTNTTTGKIIKPTIRESGYHRIAIIDTNGKRLTLTVHKLVATLFIGPPPSNQHTIDHIDRDTTNNYYGNLRWATNEEQVINRSNKGSTTGRRVNQYDLHGNFIKTWNTAQEAGDSIGLGTNVRNIPAVCKGKRNHVAGYIWKYTDEVETIDNEIWKLIPYPEYEETHVSDLGRVRSHSGKIIYGQNRDGYLAAVIKSLISMNNKSFFIHRLVMKTFVGSAEGRQVNHIDGNKTNNKLENLEYTTGTGNLLHAHATGLVKQYCRPVIKTILATGEQIIYPSIQSAAQAHNVYPSCIRRRCEREPRLNNKDGIHWSFGQSIDSTDVSSTDLNNKLPAQQFLSLKILH